jgi:hypothetical protein
MMGRQMKLYLWNIAILISFLPFNLISPVYAQRTSTKSLSENPAANERQIKREAFSFLYDSTWVLDKSDTEYNPDSFLSFDSRTKNGFITIIIYDHPTDSKKNVNEQLAEHRATTMKTSTYSRFSQWGKYKGSGVILKGRIMDTYPGEIKVFSYSNSKVSFLVVSQIFDDDKKLDQPGLKVIENSFQLK